MFNEKKIHKKYWTLVRNIPDPDEGIFTFLIKKDVLNDFLGIIDIPLIEARVGGRYKVKQFLISGRFRRYVLTYFLTFCRLSLLFDRVRPRRDSVVFR